jgi:hypothetical protein
MQPSSHARRIALFLLIVLAIAGATLVIRHRRAAHKVAAAPVLAAQVDGRPVCWPQTVCLWLLGVSDLGINSGMCNRVPQSNPNYV